MTKSELRLTSLARQRSLSANERREQSIRIADCFFETVDLLKIKVLHCFIAIEKFNEIDTTHIFQKLWKDYPLIETVVPRVNFTTGGIENLRFDASTELVTNVWSISEPAHREFVDTKQIDLVIVPLLCFDMSGHRVGYGKGFYDKFLRTSRIDCRKIGVSYFPPADEIPEITDHDVRLNAVLTPDRFYSFQA